MSRSAARFLFAGVLILFVTAAVHGQAPDPDAARLLAEANAARAAAGAQSLRWDAKLASAAKLHCERMAAEGPIAHRYPGEADVAGRAATAGARFSLLEENVAVASEPGSIHPGWMNSPGHRQNLLDPAVDAVGIAVVPARGLYYAVADYARQVPLLEPEEVESAFAGALRAYGVAIRTERRQARTLCAAGHHANPQNLQPLPLMMMHWQGPDPAQLPDDLLTRLQTGRYHQAAVGACAPLRAEGGFTHYRLVVLLYE